MDFLISMVDSINDLLSGQNSGIFNALMWFVQGLGTALFGVYIYVELLKYITTQQFNFMQALILVSKPTILFFMFLGVLAYPNLYNILIDYAIGIPIAVLQTTDNSALDPSNLIGSMGNRLNDSYKLFDGYYTEEMNRVGFTEVGLFLKLLINHIVGSVLYIILFVISVLFLLFYKFTLFFALALAPLMVLFKFLGKFSTWFDAWVRYVIYNMIVLLLVASVFAYLFAKLSNPEKLGEFTYIINIFVSIIMSGLTIYFIPKMLSTIITQPNGQSLVESLKNSGNNVKDMKNLRNSFKTK